MIAKYTNTLHFDQTNFLNYSATQRVEIVARFFHNQRTDFPDLSDTSSFPAALWFEVRDKSIPVLADGSAWRDIVLCLRFCHAR